MKNQTLYFNHSLEDLNPKSYGYDNLKNGNSTGQKVMSHTTLFFIEHGYGTFEKNGEIYLVEEGNILVTNENDIVVLRADDNTDFSYHYVSFSGELSSNFKSLPTIFRYEKDKFKILSEITNASPKSLSILVSFLFEIYSLFYINEDNIPNDYVKSTINYIENNYMNNISVEKIAGHLNLSRSYLVRIFKKNTGKTISEYLIYIRLSHAEKYLQKGMTVTDAAYFCGFGDLSNFSKMFKKSFGISPKQYKDKMKER